MQNRRQVRYNVETPRAAYTHCMDTVLNTLGGVLEDNSQALTARSRENNSYKFTGIHDAREEVVHDFGERGGAEHAVQRAHEHRARRLQPHRPAHHPVRVRHRPRDHLRLQHVTTVSLYVRSEWLKIRSGVVLKLFLRQFSLKRTTERKSFEHEKTAA